MSKGIYKDLQEFTKGHYVRCCSIKNKEKIYIGLENDGDAEGLCAVYYSAKTERKWGADCVGGYYRANSCIVPAENHAFVLVGWKGDVFAQHGLKKHSKNPSDMLPSLIEEQPIPLLSNCPISSMKVINGQAYVVGAWRTVFRRDGADSWTCLHGNDAKEVEKLQEEDRDVGFKDIDGFSKKEIYACGEGGDLWSYDGDRWKPLDVPTNKDMVSICCTSTGIVYIACDDGTLVEGRGNGWKVLKEKVADEVLDMIWYQEKLYIACGMYGLYVYDKEKIASAKGISTLGNAMGKEEGLSEGSKNALKANGLNKEDIGLINALSTVKMNSNILISPRTLATDGEILLVSDDNRVIAFNGEEWKVLFATYPSENGGELW